MAALKPRLASLPGIEEVEYGARWRQGFRRFLHGIRLVGLVGGGLLGLGMLLIMANTTRLALYAHLQDIEIMQLVGATDRFIGGPFVLTGIIQGLLSGLIGLGVLALLHHTLLGSLSVLLADTLGLHTWRFCPGLSCLAWWSAAWPWDMPAACSRSSACCASCEPHLK